MNDPHADQQDEQEMTRLAQGEDAALNRLMDRHAQKLFHFLLRALQDEGDAADLAQESFVRVYQNRARFDPRQKFTTWLYAIASNLVRDCYRWRSRHPKVSLQSLESPSEPGQIDNLQASDTPPDQNLDLKERAATVRQAIAALPDELRQPLILAFYQELPQAEIATILNCSAKAVETRIYRARQRLRVSLSRTVGACPRRKSR
jgi:RNA polymerase sigma-70 factor, ECF subfamily